MDRRQLLTRLCGFCVALIAVPLGTVLAGYGWSSSRRRTAGEPVWRSAGLVKDLPTDVPKRISVSFTTQDGWYQQTVERVYYVRVDQGTPLVLSGRCTHLGCSVRWNSPGGSFRCPCHGGMFDVEGRVVKGPPKEPLERPAVKLEGGELWIQVG
jgi:menaquinol-cytochrome c reductase iron-sulfur subunit